MKCTFNLKATGISVVLCLGLVSGMTVMAAEDGSKEGDFARGAQAWTENCVRCHNVRDPREFRDDQWKPIVYHMRVRAGLTGQDTRDILQFLIESN